MEDKLVINFSKTSKMPCMTLSMQAIDTCPGAFRADRKISGSAESNLVDACKGCYARTGNYRFPNVKAPRIQNQKMWKHENWTRQVAEKIKSEQYFRWFDSGDMYHIKLAEKILEVMKLTPDTKHWLPTRMHKFPKFAAVLEEMNSLPNVVVRFSSDSINGEFDESWEFASTITPGAIPDGQLPATMKTCYAYSRGGKCGGCRKCWNKLVKVIIYPQHGKTMAKVWRELKAA